jgi:hypothetical protein
VAATSQPPAKGKHNPLFSPASMLSDLPPLPGPSASQSAVTSAQVLSFEKPKLVHMDSFLTVGPDVQNSGVPLSTPSVFDNLLTFYGSLGEPIQTLGTIILPENKPVVVPSSVKTTLPAPPPSTATPIDIVAAASAFVRRLIRINPYDASAVPITDLSDIEDDEEEDEEDQGADQADDAVYPMPHMFSPSAPSAATGSGTGQSSLEVGADFPTSTADVDAPSSSSNSSRRASVSATDALSPGGSVTSSVASASSASAAAAAAAARRRRTRRQILEEQREEQEQRAAYEAMLRQQEVVEKERSGLTALLTAFSRKARERELELAEQKARQEREVCV